SMSQSYWRKFFSTAGIPSADAQNYAAIFEDNRITESVLGDLRKEHLTDMGIRRMGDIISILKCASTWPQTASLQSQDEVQASKWEQQQQQPMQAQLMPALLSSSSATKKQKDLQLIDKSKVPNVVVNTTDRTSASSSAGAVASLGRIVASGDGSRRFAAAPELEEQQSKPQQQQQSSAAPKRKLGDGFKAAMTAAAVGAASVRLHEASEADRPVFSRLGELSSLSSRAVAAGAAAAPSPAASNSKSSNSTTASSTHSVFNRLGGVGSSGGGAPPAVASSGGRTVLAATSGYPAAAADVRVKEPTIIRQIQFDSKDLSVARNGEEGPSPPKISMRSVDKWPSRSRVPDDSPRHRERHQEEDRRRSRQGSGPGPLSYRGVLKLPASAAASSSNASQSGGPVRKAEAHSTSAAADDLGPTLYSDSISAYSSRQRDSRDYRDSRDSRDYRDSRDSRDYRDSRDSRNSRDPARSGERIVAKARRDNGGRSSASTASGAGRLDRIVINRSVR
ncbi:hypothetical protein BOX15_Mlig033852g2, partial [Macrostomum lignano]